MEPGRSVGVPHITIPAYTVNGSANGANDFALRSAKGEIRNDPAAPPTSDQSGEAFSLLDLVDVVNPLQHIPGVNLIYRALTGDEIKPSTNVAGGALYGGPLGGLIAMASSVFSELFGADEAMPDAAGATRLADASNAGAALPDIYKIRQA